MAIPFNCRAWSLENVVGLRSRIRNCGEPHGRRGPPKDSSHEMGSDQFSGLDFWVEYDT